MSELVRPLSPGLERDGTQTLWQSIVDRIGLLWEVRGILPLPSGQSAEDALDRLAPAFDAYGTTYSRDGTSLRFQKKDQAAQDKLAVFDSGTLSVERAAGGPVLRYRLWSRMLLFCFFLPLMFAGFGQLTLLVGRIDKPTAAEKAETEAKKKASDARKAAVPQHPIDKFLRAPVPETLAQKEAKAAKEKAEKKKQGKGEEEDGGSATSAYVFAGIFGFLYLVGRILEDRLVRSRFRKLLNGEA